MYLFPKHFFYILRVCLFKRILLLQCLKYFTRDKIGVAIKIYKPVTIWPGLCKQWYRTIFYCWFNFHFFMYFKCKIKGCMHSGLTKLSRDEHHKMLDKRHVLMKSPRISEWRIKCKSLETKTNKRWAGPDISDFLIVTLTINIFLNYLYICSFCHKLKYRVLYLIKILERYIFLLFHNYFKYNPHWHMARRHATVYGLLFWLQIQGCVAINNPKS